MASPENILLHLPEDQEQQVLDVFAKLEDLGFPRQQQRPHITITFARSMTQSVVERAAELLPSLVPATFRRVGTVVFGRQRKQTVAWLLETSDELEIAARKISAANPDGRGSRWIPHLTVGLRLPREIIPEYIRALDDVIATQLTELTAVRAALWRPQQQELTILAGDNTSTSIRD